MERYSIFLGRKINLVKMTIQPNAIYRFTVIPFKLPMAFFTKLEQNNFTSHMETQKTPDSQSCLENEEWNWGNQAPRLQTILQSYSHQDSMVLAQNRNIDQWNR